MNIFKTIGNLFKKKEVKDLVVKAAYAAIDLGAFNFIANFFGKSFKKVTQVDQQLVAKFMEFSTRSVLDTQVETDKGKLATGEEKRGFALERFKFYLLNDDYTKSNTNLIQVAPLFIQIVYDANKLRTLLDKQNRDEVANMMVEIGKKALTQKDFDPVKEFFTQLENLND